MLRTVRVAALIGAVSFLAACATGERPSYAPDDGTSSGASGITSTTAASGVDASVLALFNTSLAVSETAKYEIHQTLQGITAPATFTRDATRTILDVRDVQFRNSGGKRETCNRSSMSCRLGFAEQRLSDLQISSGFWGPAVLEALTSPTVTARIGPITTDSDTVAGQAVTCVSIPGPSRVDRYCALPSGTLASMDTAAVTITLTSYESSFDSSLWDEYPHD